MKILAPLTIALATLAAAGSIEARQSAPFQGAWEHCDSYRRAQYCSSYVLLQNGRNVCGTWDYTASSSGYAGQLKATALSATTLRKDQVCGSPGSETRTECSEEGTPQVSWEPAHGRLYLMGSGMNQYANARKPYFRRRPVRHGERAELQAQAWVASCLARQSP